MPTLRVKHVQLDPVRSHQLRPCRPPGSRQFVEVCSSVRRSTFHIPLPDVFFWQPLESCDVRASAMRADP